MRPDASLVGIDCNSVTPNCIALSLSILLLIGSSRSARECTERIPDAPSVAGGLAVRQCDR